MTLLAAACGGDSTTETASSVAAPSPTPVVTSPGSTAVGTTAISGPPSVVAVDDTARPGSTSPGSQTDQPPDPCDDGRQPALVAFARATGERLWAECLPAAEEHFIVAAHSGVVLVLAYGRGQGPDPLSFVAYDAVSATELWERPIDTRGVPTVLAGHGHFYLLDAYSPEATETSLRALDTATGREVWRVDQIGVAWSGDNTLAVVPTPSGTDGEPPATAPVRGLDPATGRELWTYQLDAGLQGPYVGLSAAAFANSDTVFVTAGDRRSVVTVAVDLDSGEQRWQAEFAGAGRRYQRGARAKSGRRRRWPCQRSRCPHRRSAVGVGQ